MRIVFVVCVFGLLLVSVTPASSLILLENETIKDGKNDWKYDENSESPADVYIESIDIQTVGYTADVDSGFLLLSTTFHETRKSDGQYQLQYRLSLDLDHQHLMEIECQEFINILVEEFSVCTVEFWVSSSDSSSSHRYFFEQPDYDFEWFDYDLNWQFNLNDILINEERTEQKMGDLFSAPSTLNPFDTTSIRLPLLDIQMGVSKDSSDLVSDEFFRGQQDTTKSQLFFSNYWYYLLSLPLIVLVLLKRNQIRSWFNSLQEKS